MKIAQIVCVYPPYKGGIGTAAQGAYNTLKEKHQVTNFSFGKELNDEVKYLEPLLKFGNGAFIPKLYRELKSFNLIYLHYPFFGTTEIVWLFKLLHKKTKLVIHYHMDTKDLSPLAKVLSLSSRLIERSLVKQVDKIIVSSTDYIKSSSWAKYYKKWPNKFNSIPFSVDTKLFRPNPEKETTETKKILFVGGLDKAHYFKGVRQLLIALSEIKKSWSLNIVGSGDLEDEYKQLAKDLEIIEKIKFIDNAKQEDLIKEYQNADFLVLSSINSHEAFGIVLIEAMACGLPVIASRLPGVRTVFSNNKEGLYSKPTDILDLKNKIEEMMKKHQAMNIAARDLAETRYDKEIVAKELLKIFNI